MVSNDDALIVIPFLYFFSSISSFSYLISLYFFINNLGTNVIWARKLPGVHMILSFSVTIKTEFQELLWRIWNFNIGKRETSEIHKIMVEPAPSFPQSSDLQSNAVEASGQHSSVKILQSIIIAFAWAFDGQQTFITVFTDAEPKWKCLDPTDPICNQASRPCGLKPDSWSWASPANTSIVSEWDLQCANTAFFFFCYILCFI